MKRVLAFAILLCSGLALHAQSQYALFTCSNMPDLAGNKMASGTITFTPVLAPNSTVPAHPHLVGGGRAIGSPVTFQITNGACSAITGTMQLVDVTQANPANFCYADSVHDNNSGDTWTPDTCVQPAYNASWCTVAGGQTTCNFDNYVPTGVPGALQSLGPAGMNWRGAWSGGTSYNVNDAVSYSGSSYVNSVQSNTATPPGTGWTVLASQGSSGVGTDSNCSTNGIGFLKCLAVESSKTPEVNCTAYGAVGDCTGTGSTAGCTDNHSPLQACFDEAKVIGSPVILPSNPTATGATVYYTSAAINPEGVSFRGPIGSPGQSQGYALVAVRGAPGKDVFNVPDPGAVGPPLLSKGFTVRDIGIINDDTVDASSSGLGSFPNRFPGRFFFDGVANGTAVITSAVQAEFQPGDVGQAISINGVTTTIASYQSVNQVTLGTTVPTGTGLTAYISVAGLSATQTLGNCGFAMDASGLAGGYGNGPLRADFTNVAIDNVVGRLNYTCGYFFQGNVGPYQTKWDHDFVGGYFGFVFAEANTAAALVGGNTCQGMCDTNRFEDTWIASTYPWISYGGNVETLHLSQITGQTYGMQILPGNGTVSGAGESLPSAWKIDIPEIEGPCPLSGPAATTFRISGIKHTVDRLSVSGCNGGGSTLPIVQWDASYSTVANLLLVNQPVNIAGNLNSFFVPFYPTGAPTITDTGVGNRLVSCSAGNIAYGIDPGRCQYAGITNTGDPTTTFGPPSLRRGAIALNITGDFIKKGAGAPYFNDEDLWYWPTELTGASSAVPTTPDSTTLAAGVGGMGKAIALTGSSGIQIVEADGTGLFYGYQVPAGKMRFYVMAKANTSLVWNFNLASYSSGTGYNGLCSSSPTLTTSYALYYCDADATSYPSTDVYMNLGAPGTGNTVNVAWMAIKPWFSDLEVNGPIQSSAGVAPGTSSTTQIVNTLKCVKTVGPPEVDGYCSTSPAGTPPTCTCN